MPRQMARIGRPRASAARASASSKTSRSVSTAPSFVPALPVALGSRSGPPDIRPRRRGRAATRPARAPAGADHRDPAGGLDRPAGTSAPAPSRARRLSVGVYGDGLHPLPTSRRGDRDQRPGVARVHVRHVLRHPVAADELHVRGSSSGRRMGGSPTPIGQPVPGQRAKAGPAVVQARPGCSTSSGQPPGSSRGAEEAVDASPPRRRAGKPPAPAGRRARGAEASARSAWAAGRGYPR